MNVKCIEVHDYKAQAASLACLLNPFFGFQQAGSVVKTRTVPGLFVLVQATGKRNLEVNYVENGEWKRRNFSKQDSVILFVKKYLSLD